jgi:hypothetical protein
MAYSFKNSKGVTYYLHTMIVKLKGSGKKQQIFWFATKVGSRALDALPKGYKVVTSKKTGLPFVKKG